MINVPAVNARRAAFSNTCEYGCPTCTGAPSDIDTMAQPFVMAHCMPARMPASAPLPWSDRTLPVKISVSKATP
jgi:hypothetical protein